MAITHFALIANVLLNVAHFKINDLSWPNKLMCPGDVSMGGRPYYLWIVRALLMDFSSPILSWACRIFRYPGIHLFSDIFGLVFNVSPLLIWLHTLLRSLKLHFQLFCGVCSRCCRWVKSLDLTWVHQMSIVVVPKFSFTQFLQSIVKYRITCLKYFWTILFAGDRLTFAWVWCPHRSFFSVSKKRLRSTIWATSNFVCLEPLHLMGNSVHPWGQYFRMLLSVKAMVTAPLRELLYLIFSVWRSHGMRRFSLPNPSRHQRCHCWECWEVIARIQDSRQE